MCQPLLLGALSVLSHLIFIGGKLLAHFTDGNDQSVKLKLYGAGI